MNIQPVAALTSDPADAELIARGFCFLPRERSLQALGGLASFADWPQFAASWNDLGLDTHMADGGHYRRRRHAVFSASMERGIERLPDAPHYQALHYNRLNGGIERWFLPVLESTASTSSFLSLFAYAQQLFSALAPEVQRWQVEAHQFRIEAQPGQPGLPTPEGVHRDGVDYVLVALVQRHNIRSGTTTIHGGDAGQLGEFTLTEALDLALVDDQRVWHGVTAVEPVDPTLPAWRDVLVLTFRRAEQIVAVELG